MSWFGNIQLGIFYLRDNIPDWIFSILKGILKVFNQEYFFLKVIFLIEYFQNQIFLIEYFQN